MIDAVLVERTVADVTPSLKATLDMVSFSMDSLPLSSKMELTTPLFFSLIS